MGTLGLQSTHSGNEVRVGFRQGWLRYVNVAMGGAGIIGVVIAALQFADHDPKASFDLLSRWGSSWILVLVFGWFAYQIALKLIDELRRLATGVQDSAVAIARIAEKDDRDRDRMITETAYVSTRVTEMATTLREMREEMREALKSRQGG